ncbi:serine protease [Pseudonocardia sichuanensis]
MSRCRSAVLAAAVAVLAVLAEPAAAAAPAPAGTPPFAPAADAAITPGVRMLSPVGDGAVSTCTAAFVFRGGDTTYLGYAAHCAGSGESMGLSGCEEPALPLGTDVVIEGNDGSRTAGRLAYTSWGTMQERGETDGARCYSNDFALVELDPADVERVNPSVPVFGGPTALDTDGTRRGEPVYSYQPRNGGTVVKQGRSLGVSAGGLFHRVETAPPGRPGDSGSGYVDGDGDAFGVLSTLFLDGSSTNGVTDLAHALAYANAYGGIGRVALVPGTEPFGVRT